MFEDNEDAADSLIVVKPPAAPSTTTNILGGEVAAAAAYRRRAKSANTIRAYESDWRQFEGWCDESGLEALPARPEAVATWLAVLAQAGRADSTIGRHLAAIGWQQRQQGQVPPTARDERTVIADTLAGIRREARDRPSNRKAALAAHVRRQNIWHNLRRRLAECGPHLGVDVKRRACGVASADVRWFVV